MKPPNQEGGGALEFAVGRVLRLGVAATTICLTLGLVLTFAGAGRSAAPLLTSGLIILLATPVARVVVSIVEYARDRDRLFFALTLIVLLELGASVFAAIYRAR